MNQTDFQSSYNQSQSKTQFSVELLGPGGLYSLYGSYRFNQNVAGNIGLGLYPAFYNRNMEVLSGFQIPMSFSYLFFGDSDHHLEMNGGINLGLLVNIDTGEFSKYGSLVGGFGYRYWPNEGGFHFRTMFYSFWVPTGLGLSAGISFGIAI